MSHLPTRRTIDRLVQCLEDRLNRIDKRSKAVVEELKASIRDSEEHRELLREQLDLKSLAAATRNALFHVQKRETKEEQERHERTVTLMVRELDAQLVRSQANWRRQADYRSARVYRMAHLDARFRVEQELGTTGLPTV